MKSLRQVRYENQTTQMARHMFCKKITIKLKNPVIFGNQNIKGSNPTELYN